MTRTRTPPTEKWLLNERAALIGKLEKQAQRIQAQQAKVNAIEVRLAQARTALEQAHKVLHDTQVQQDALDLAIGQANSNVCPDAAGKVQAWAGKYGSRGALREFVAKLLQDVAPQPLTTGAIMSAAQLHFQLVFENTDERTTFRYTIRKYLRQMRDNDATIECLHQRRLGEVQGVWRWKAALPSLSTLALLSQTAQQQDEQTRVVHEGAASWR